MNLLWKKHYQAIGDQYRKETLICLNKEKKNN